MKEFQYIDEDGKDQGANGQFRSQCLSRSFVAESEISILAVRQKAKDITSLILDEKRMKSQRATRKDMRSRMAGERPDSGAKRDRSNSRPPAPKNGDDDLQAAIEASKRSAEEEARRNRGNDDMEEAMRLSREEDERRRRELENGNNDLFDEQRQYVLCDLLLEGNLIDDIVVRRNQSSLIDMDAPSQQPMATGWASFNPYAAQQQAQMEEYMRQQQLMELQRQVGSHPFPLVFSFSLR